MKKIIFLFFSIFIFLSFSVSFAEDCSYRQWEDLKNSITRCIEDGNYWWVLPPWNLDLTSWDWFSNSIKSWSEKIAILVGSLAIFMLVYASFLLVVSAWEEEKIKKAKDIIKWVILWFIWLISAWLIVMLVVKLWYFFGQI